MFRTKQYGISPKLISNQWGNLMVTLRGSIFLGGQGFCTEILEGLADFLRSPKCEINQPPPPQSGYLTVPNIWVFVTHVTIYRVTTQLFFNQSWRNMYNSLPRIFCQNVGIWPPKYPSIGLAPHTVLQFILKKYHHALSWMYVWLLCIIKWSK